MNTHLGAMAALLPVLALAACGGGDTGTLAIEAHPQSLMVKDGESAMFNVTGVMGGTHVPLRYQWRRNGVDLPGETKAWLLLGSVSPADDQAEYMVVISDGAGQRATSKPGVLAVVPADTSMPWR